ncbi:MAG TPA: hypothetical protein VEQ58_15455, partial [Polyangiaceae bacterium]|nr:hypothetical protein [Polyangiaceae bacterium]
DYEHYVDDSSFTLAGGPATLLSGGDFTYREAHAASGDVHFQRWLTADLEAGVDTPTMDLTFGGSTNASNPTTVFFDVDPVARVAVLVTSWVEVGTTVNGLFWIDLSSGSPQVVEATSLNGWRSAGVRVRGDRIVWAETMESYATKLHFLQRGSGADQSLELADSISRLLAFDGATAYYAVQNGLGAVTNQPGAPVVSLDLPMLGTPSALTATPTALVATSAGQLLTLSPVCH